MIEYANSHFRPLFIRVNTDGGINDQWMPMITVKPDGSKLFIAWYDRRNDINNSMIDVYGRWGTIAATDGAVTFPTAEFRITTTSFPPVFAGTLPGNQNNGHYDPVYPPAGVNLHWWYSGWPTPDPQFPQENLTGDAYIGHVGEYNGVCTDGANVYIAWTDNRLTTSGTRLASNQSDIRMAKII